MRDASYRLGVKFTEIVLVTSTTCPEKCAFGYTADLTHVLKFVKTTPQHFLFLSTQGADPLDFTIVEKVSAGT